MNEIIETTAFIKKIIDNYKPQIHRLIRIIKEIFTKKQAKLVFKSVNLWQFIFADRFSYYSNI